MIAALGLAPHPEGGHYRETFRGAAPPGERGAFSSIYFLLRRGERSAWHRIRDAAEVWHHHAGAALELEIAAHGGLPSVVLLGPNVGDGERPQALVPAAAWQRARTLGDWTLVGCTVSPAFEFAAFELAPSGWQPG